jgi:hypothetical protein
MVQLLVHFPFRCHWQHMFGIGDELVWSMKTCQLLFGVIAKMFF